MIQNALRTSGQIASTLLLSWLIGLGLLAGLLIAGDPWEVLAISRILDPFIESGIVQYHDTQQGMIPGIPDVKWFLWANDPIDWRLLGVSAFLLIAVSAVRGVQFREVLSRCGVSCDARIAGRALVLGQGMNRWMPFNGGDVATALTLKTGGVDAGKASQALYLMRVLFVIELVIFSIIGLVVLGWMDWLLQLFWAVVILGAAILALRPNVASSTGWGDGKSLRAALKTLGSDLPSSAKLILLALATFLLEHIAVYVMAMAFTTVNVLLNIPFQLFLMALVAGFVARLVPVTPGGIGQFEWGFAAALYFGGISMPMASATALIFLVLRYFVGTVVDLLARTGATAPDSRSVVAVLSGSARVEDSASR